MSAAAFAALEWHAAPLPGGNAPAQLAQLPRAGDGAFRAFVLFPAGWSRPGAGHYPVAEEFFILEGDLRLNDITWREGGYAWVPANRVRSASRSESGCLAVAWFASAPRWIPGAPNEAALPRDVMLAHWRNAPTSALGANGSGRQLYAGPEHHTWIVQRRHVPLLAGPRGRYEMLDLIDHTWRSDTAHESHDDPSGAVLVRVWNGL